MRDLFKNFYIFRRFFSYFLQGPAILQCEQLHPSLDRLVSPCINRIGFIPRPIDFPALNFDKIFVCFWLIARSQDIEHIIITYSLVCTHVYLIFICMTICTIFIGFYSPIFLYINFIQMKFTRFKLKKKTNSGNNNNNETGICCQFHSVAPLLARLCVCLFFVLLYFFPIHIHIYIFARCARAHTIHILHLCSL